MRVAIHQPQYLPWLGYLAKWAAADVFVFLDTVQYEKYGWQNRNRIRTPDGAHWLTVPVHAHLGMPIVDVAVDTTQPCRTRHLRAIEHAYTRAPHFSAHHDGEVTVAQAQALERTSDPLDELAYALGANRLNDRFWRQTLENLARHVGVATPVVEVQSVCIDKRRQWRHAGNLRNSAILRTARHTMTAPARWLTRRG